MSTVMLINILGSIVSGTVIVAGISTLTQLSLNRKLSGPKPRKMKL